MHCNCLVPLVDENSRILILGSMHGMKSLQEQQYYAHPQNRFWKLMCVLLKDHIDLSDYENKKAMALRNGIALWETLSFCEREGSLDSNITEEIPNDIVGLLAKYPNIKTVICNGGKAGNVFKKHIAPNLPQDIKVYYFHSTSPANARMRLENLADEWSIAFE